ncbi:hypothetical protein H9P43_008486 [Blastocladiella emersonii ATCC 22665]|nr:hypothetical protein H9P43_008486 [Blastocladiella emersonii ATCC 22665]
MSSSSRPVPPTTAASPTPTTTSSSSRTTSTSRSTSTTASTETPEPTPTSTDNSTITSTTTTTTTTLTTDTTTTTSSSLTSSLTTTSSTTSSTPFTSAVGTAISSATGVADASSSSSGSSAGTVIGISAAVIAAVLVLGIAIFVIRRRNRGSATGYMARNTPMRGLFKPTTATTLPTQRTGAGLAPSAPAPSAVPIPAAFVPTNFGHGYRTLPVAALPALAQAAAAAQAASPYGQSGSLMSVDSLQQLADEWISLRMRIESDVRAQTMHLTHPTTNAERLAMPPTVQDAHNERADLVASAWAQILAQLETGIAVGEWRAHTVDAVALLERFLSMFPRLALVLPLTGGLVRGESMDLFHSVYDYPVDPAALRVRGTAFGGLLDEHANQILIKAAVIGE